MFRLHSLWQNNSSSQKYIKILLRKSSNSEIPKGKIRVKYGANNPNDNIPFNDAKRTEKEGKLLMRINTAVAMFLITPACLLLGGTMLGSGCYNFYQSIVFDAYYTKTKAEVIKCECNEEKESFNRYLQYSFKIGDQEYISENIDFADRNSLTKAEAQSFEKEICSKKEIDIRYNPLNPTVSALFPGPQTGQIAKIFFGFIILVPPVLLYNRYVRKSLIALIARR
eukprot:c11485_g1_i1.p1 GENE.c11485_g1_i1~~c11485_g1_i1.p1  ORF type:complete len:232 (+),score=63.92 c11485_g1_i1:22-696(+)